MKCTPPGVQLHLLNFGKSVHNYVFMGVDFAILFFLDNLNKMIIIIPQVEFSGYNFDLFSDFTRGFGRVGIRFSMLRFLKNYAKQLSRFLESDFYS